MLVAVPVDPLEPVDPLGVVDVVAGGAHDAVALVIGPTPAGTICAGGVPGGTLTLKLSDCPVTNVTVTVH